MVGLSLAGCDKVKEATGIDGPKQAGNAVESVRQAAGVAGSIELTLDAPLAASGCYVSLLSPGGGRPNVLQITSYRDPSGESFPSVFVQARVGENPLTALTGLAVEAIVFAQGSPDGPVWQTLPSAPAKLTISAAGGSEFSAELTGELVNVESGARQAASGKFSSSDVRTKP